MKKKYLILAFALCVVLSGCGEKNELSSKGESMNVSADTASDEGASVHNDDAGTASDNNSQEDTKQEESNKDNNQSDSQIESTASTGDTTASSVDAVPSDTTAITQDMAYQGVDNYCHKEYDWSIAKDNPDIMYVYMGEETDTEYLVIFRSYTGSFVYFYVNKSTGLTRMVDVVPLMDLEEESGTINIYDYL